MKFVVSILICALIAFSTADSNTIKVELFSGSNANWIAIAVQNADVDTIAVQIKDSSSEGASWASMKLISDWGYWIVSSPNKFVFPLSVRLTSKTSEELTVENAIPSFDSSVVDTGVQFAAPASAALSPRRYKHGHSTTTAAPTQKATTSAPTTSKSTSKASTTTVKPTVKATPVTTSKPVLGGKPPVTPSSSGMKLLVPLYTYPGASWTSVAAGGALVPTVAIINPNSGPGTGPDSSYNTYMNTLHAAGVEMIGYVHTSYGARAIADVKADIAAYASEFPLVNGIFIDEASASANDIAYYTQVHNYIMSMPGYKYNVLNPGTVPAQGYMSISTQIVSFEDLTSKFAASQTPSFASASNKDHFAVIAYAASSSAMQSALNAAKSKGWYGWVYFCDGAQGGSTYNTLATYYSAQASYLASIN